MNQSNLTRFLDALSIAKDYFCLERPQKLLWFLCFDFIPLVSFSIQSQHPFLSFNINIKMTYEGGR